LIEPGILSDDEKSWARKVDEKEWTCAYSPAALKVVSRLAAESMGVAEPKAGSPAGVAVGVSQTPFPDSSRDDDPIETHTLFPNALAQDSKFCEIEAG